MAPVSRTDISSAHILSGLSSCAEGGARRHAFGHRWVCGSRPDRRRQSRPRLVEVLTFLVRRGLVAFGSTTLAFAALDLWEARFLRQTSWDPRLLPAVVRLKIAFATQFADSAGAFVCRASVAVARALLSNPDFRRRRGVLKLTSIWSVVYVPMVVLTAAELSSTR